MTCYSSSNVNVEYNTALAQQHKSYRVNNANATYFDINVAAHHRSSAVATAGDHSTLPLELKE